MASVTEIQLFCHKVLQHIMGALSFFPSSKCTYISLLLKSHCNVLTLALYIYITVSYFTSDIVSHLAVYNALSSDTFGEFTTNGSLGPGVNMFFFFSCCGSVFTVVMVIGETMATGLWVVDGVVGNNFLQGVLFLEKHWSLMGTLASFTWESMFSSLSRFLGFTLQGEVPRSTMWTAGLCLWRTRKCK